MSACPPTAMATSFFSGACARTKPGKAPTVPATPAIFNSSRRLMVISGLLVSYFFTTRRRYHHLPVSGSTSGVATLHQCPGDGTGIHVFQFASRGHTPGQSGDLAPSDTQQLGEIMSGRLAFGSEVGGKYD